MLATKQPQGEWQLTDAHQQTIRQIIEAIFTQEDWDAILPAERLRQRS